MGTAETTSKGEMFMYGMYGYGYGYGLDPTIILVLIGVALSLWAQGRVNSTFSRYSRVRSMTGMTGAEAARRLLNLRCDGPADRR